MQLWSGRTVYNRAAAQHIDTFWNEAPTEHIVSTATCATLTRAIIHGKQRKSQRREPETTPRAPNLLFWTARDFRCTCFNSHSALSEVTASTARKIKRRETASRGKEKVKKNEVSPVDERDDECEEFRVESGRHGLQTLQSRDLRTWSTEEEGISNAGERKTAQPTNRWAHFF